MTYLLVFDVLILFLLLFVSTSKKNIDTAVVIELRDVNMNKWFVRIPSLEIPYISEDIKYS